MESRRVDLQASEFLATALITSLPEVSELSRLSLERPRSSSEFEQGAGSSVAAITHTRRARGRRGAGQAAMPVCALHRDDPVPARIVEAIAVRWSTKATGARRSGYAPFALPRRRATDDPAPCSSPRLEPPSRGNFCSVLWAFPFLYCRHRRERGLSSFLELCVRRCPNGKNYPPKLLRR